MSKRRVTSVRRLSAHKLEATYEDGSRCIIPTRREISEFLHTTVQGTKIYQDGNLLVDAGPYYDRRGEC